MKKNNPLGKVAGENVENHLRQQKPNKMKNFWKSALRWLPGVVISVGIILLILYFVDLRKFIDAIRSANYWLLLITFFISVLWLFIRGFVWHSLMAGKASYRDVFLSINEGYLLNNFLPFKLGEVGKAFLLARKAGMAFMEVLPTVFIERILDIAFAALIFLGSLPFVAGAFGTEGVILTIGCLVIASIFILYLLTRNRTKVMQWSDRVFIRWPRLFTFQKRLLEPLFSGLGILTDGKILLRVLFFMTLNWAVAILQFYFLLLAFFPQAKLVWALFSLGALAFGNAIPSLPGSVGTFEGALTAALTILSGNQSISFAAAIVAHLLNYLTSGIIGLYAFSREGETVMGVYHQLMKRREIAK